MRKALIILLCISSLLLSSCSSRSYEDGYADGHDAGYQAGLDSVNVALSETTTPTKSFSDNLLPQAEPKNGYLFEEITGWECVAPLTIETSGDGGYYFVIDPIKLYSADNSEFADTRSELAAKYFFMRFYVNAGNKVELKVPLGEYEIYYAYGATWYGEEYLFGSDTVYYKCDDTFIFKESSNGFNGWTLSLTPTVNGNLDTDIIIEADFPKAN